MKTRNSTTEALTLYPFSNSSFVAAGLVKDLFFWNHIRIRNLIFTATGVNGPSNCDTNVELCARLSLVNIGGGRGKVVALELCVIGATRMVGGVGCPSEEI